MSVVPITTHTPAEEALFETFDQAKAELSGDMDARNAAMVALKKSGLPTRRVEAWHYTDLRTALKDVPTNLVDLDENDEPRLVKPETWDGFSTTPFEGAELGFRGSDDAIGKINSSMAAYGMVGKVEAGTVVSTPIEFQNVVNDGARHVRHNIDVGAGAEATFVERELGREGFGTCVSDIVVGDGAKVTYVIVQQTDETSTHLGQINAKIGADAVLTLFVLNAGGKLVRQEVNVETTGEGADFHLRGVNLIGDNQHIDVTMDLNHAVPHTTSEEIIRNVIIGKGKGVFQGKIRVAQIAQKTDAQMACNTLLLTDDGDFSTKPELEIFADDVACGHGATFTDIEPSYMFYLMSRGIPEKEARALLIKGFVDEIVGDLENEPLEESLVKIIDGWLDAHG